MRQRTETTCLEAAGGGDPLVSGDDGPHRPKRGQEAVHTRPVWEAVRCARGAERGANRWDGGGDGCLPRSRASARRSDGRGSFIQRASSTRRRCLPSPAVPWTLLVLPRGLGQGTEATPGPRYRASDLSRPPLITARRIDLATRRSSQSGWQARPWSGSPRPSGGVRRSGSTPSALRSAFVHPTSHRSSRRLGIKTSSSPRSAAPGRHRSRP